MPAKNRANPLALAVLTCLYEGPMHPYEVATTLRQRHKDESVRLNFGSLYGVVESLERRGLIEAQETRRSGRLPERTVYRLTEAGQIEMHDWLTDLISTPVKDYPTFQAALSFLPALPPDDVVTLLTERAHRLESEIAAASGARDLIQKKGLPRLLWLEGQFAVVLREAELDFVRQLIRDIETGALDGTDWWREVHDRADEPAWLPPLGDYAPRGDEGSR
ncbi:MAG TPA: PadR family transcriptional regulator [Streptosporangiaceae bacterium]|nr:PadR family transcriptional regulator [Streptosporangiaceae bacterium]